MKKINILLVFSLLLTGLCSCNDFLNVNSESKFTDDYVFGDKDEINRALNTVYAQLMSKNTYGDKYMNTYALNSDVEYTTYSSNSQSTSGNGYRYFDATRNGSDLSATWTAAYNGIEYANIFIHGLENSAIYNPKDTIFAQQLGEAKVLRAMFYHDLIVLFGDIPFSFTQNYLVEDMVMPVVDREEIYKALIEDLKGAAPGLRFANDLTEGVERVSKEFCWSMIARMALTCGGYSLYPDKDNPLNIGTMKRPVNYKDYYKIAEAYCDSVISSGTHQLSKSFSDVFIDECNYIVDTNDDPIFEIPFLKGTSGSVGYLHGPQGAVNAENLTTGKNVWGKSSGGLRLNAFYRYSFDRKDLRLNQTVGMWYYTFDGVPTMRVDYTTHCNKWSKFWSTSGNSMGVSSDGGTGINYPYMRYADVLLMYAEAVNELEDGVSGPHGQKAINAFKQVRNRAFASEDRPEKVDQYVANASGSKEAFLEIIANERKWEFGGENMRWKDLVRWNKYAKVIYDTFMEYYAVGSIAGGDGQYDPDGKYDMLPINMYYKVATNPGKTIVYPNTTLDILDIKNPYDFEYAPASSEGYSTANFYQWWDDTNSVPTAQCRFSMRGYIYVGEEETFTFTYNNSHFTPPVDEMSLPPVRYILPFPNDAIQRSFGAYKNYYGYN